MIYVGIDIGSTTTKLVAMEERQVRWRALQPTGSRPADAAATLFAQMLAETKVTKPDIAVIAATGYGRRLTDLGDMVLTEIKACALGVQAAENDDGAVKTIIDVGGQDTKVVALGPNADIVEFSMNDKCAAGTGRFLEVLARTLDMTYTDFVAAAMESTASPHMNSTCAVFAESEVIGMLARGVSKPDIAAAAHHAIAMRIAAMARRVGHGGPYRFVGGGALNQALVRSIAEHLDDEVLALDNPQTVIALGAAVGGRKRYEKFAKSGSVGAT